MTSDSYCIADLQQKNSTKAENLRNVSAEVIPLHFQMVKIKKRRHNYMSKTTNAKHIRKFIQNNFGFYFKFI